MLIVGTMIGAGFCSGREIVSFFGSGISVLVAPLCGLCIFAACVLFLWVGDKTGENRLDKVNGALLGKYHMVADFFLLVNNFIVLSAMIAGFNSLCKPLIAFPIMGSIAAAVCAVIAAKGASGLLNCNFAVVPVIVVCLAAVCFCGLKQGDLSASVGVFRLRNFPVSVVYVSMNMMLASTVLTTMGKLSKKEIVWGSAIAALLITALLLLLITALNGTGNYDAEMPILEISEGGGTWLYVVLCLVTAISIFTTMLTAVGGLCGYMHGKCGGRAFDSFVVVSAGTALSFFGFTRVVSLFYPLVGVFGLLYICVCLHYVRVSRTPKKTLRLPRAARVFPKA